MAKTTKNNMIFGDLLAKGNNKVRITDEMIERRVAIPKRTIMAHKKELIKYDLIKSSTTSFS